MLCKCQAFFKYFVNKRFFSTRAWWHSEGTILPYYTYLWLCPTHFQPPRESLQNYEIEMILLSLFQRGWVNYLRSQSHYRWWCWSYQPGSQTRLPEFLCCCFLLLLFYRAHSIEKCLGQGLNLSHSSDNTRSLTRWATRELPKFLNMSCYCLPLTSL